MSALATEIASPYPIDWTHVRGVYKKLQTDFHLLTEPFGIRISESRNRDLSHLICAIDVVDRQLDEIDMAEHRAIFMKQTLDYLRGETQAKLPDGSDEFLERMDCLKEIITRLKIQATFCETVKTVVAHGEKKRVATDQPSMIHHLVEEWRLTGKLPVLVMGEFSTPDFESFFYHCCATMPAIDMLQDARMDYRNGQITIRPSLWLHCKLLWVFLAGIPTLIYRFPRPFVLFRYAISFIWEGLTRKDP